MLFWRYYRRRSSSRRRGVTSTEYAVMLALLLGTAMSSINCLGRRTQGVFNATGQRMSGTNANSNGTGS